MACLWVVSWFLNYFILSNRPGIPQSSDLANHGLYECRLYVTFLRLTKTVLGNHDTPTAGYLETTTQHLAYGDTCTSSSILWVRSSGHSLSIHQSLCDPVFSPSFAIAAGWLRRNQQNLSVLFFFHKTSLLKKQRAQWFFSRLTTEICLCRQNEQKWRTQGISNCDPDISTDVFNQVKNRKGIFY